jgi:hypothetical protein
MAKMIGVTAEVGRIEEHVRASYRAALARGEGIGEAGKARLQEAVADIDAAAAGEKRAEAVRADAWQVVLAEEAKCDSAIGAVADEVWNALGRPRLSRYFDQVFPGGLTTYTRGEPKVKATLLQVLIDRVVKATAPALTKDKKDGWVARLEERRKPFQEAVEAYRPAEAAAMVAHFSYRSAVRAGWGRLRELKRDLQNLGLKEAAIAEIIPGDSPPPHKEMPAPSAVVPTLPVVKAA